MIPNTNYANLQNSYLFYNITQKVNAYLADHPGATVIHQTLLGNAAAHHSGSYAGHAFRRHNGQ